MSFVPLVRLWLWVSAFASAAGWTLSAFGQLNRTGYGNRLRRLRYFPFARTQGTGFVFRRKNHFA